MKEIVLSNCERNFILKAAQELKRLDGRKLEGFRNLKVHFGQNWGLCYVALGETKVLTQVTCEIQEPKTTGPNEGLLYINVELSAMAAPNFEAGRPSDLSVHLNRLLEKCIKDSRAVDLESLCIVAEEKVWALRVDVNILNHDGNLIDCASVSALAALAHFKRPDVTTDGQEIKVHSPSERDPIPITLHHYPVCVSFALLNNSENIFADPTEIEERVSDASLTFGINSYREICCMHLGGVALIKPKMILSCSTKAATRAKEVVELIKEALKNDSEARLSKKSLGFVDTFEWNKLTALSKDRLKIQLPRFTLNENKTNEVDVPMKSESDIKDFDIIDLGDNCAELNPSKSNKNLGDLNDASLPSKKLMKKDNENGILKRQVESYGEGGFSKWVIDLKFPNPPNDSDSDSNKDRDEICEIPIEPKTVESIELRGDSEEEEEVVILNPDETTNAQSNFSKKMPSQKTERPDRNSYSESEKPKKKKKKKNNSRKNLLKMGKVN